MAGQREAQSVPWFADERPAEDARARIFHLRPGSMAAVQAWLDQIQAQWDEQLASFRRHLEGSGR